MSRITVKFTHRFETQEQHGGTQVLTGTVGVLIFGTPNQFENALLMGAAWVINLAVAEWIIRKRPTRQKHTA